MDLGRGLEMRDTNEAEAWPLLENPVAQSPRQRRRPMVALFEYHAGLTFALIVGE